ncbi:hypothetical protein AMECASPLE_019362 [Ameca splendens]|uniref:Uncharacterized protein n=1 Tax=Ameca splendens TaxID=208324 RepID=A0ABV0Z1Y5_9TELE
MQDFFDLFPYLNGGMSVSSTLLGIYTGNVPGSMHTQLHTSGSLVRSQLLAFKYTACFSGKSLPVHDSEHPAAVSRCTGPTLVFSVAAVNTVSTKHAVLMRLVR